MNNEELPGIVRLLNYRLENAKYNRYADGCLGTWATVTNEAYAEIGKTMAYSYYGKY